MIYLSHHPIPDVVDLLAMLAIGYQVQVIGELDVLCNLLQNVNAEALAALLDVRPTSLCRVAAVERRGGEENKATNTSLADGLEPQLLPSIVNCGFRRRCQNMRRLAPG